jgi:hypothetical protein
VLLKGWQTKAAETARRFRGEECFIEMISGLIPWLFPEQFFAYAYVFRVLTPFS